MLSSPGIIYLRELQQQLLQSAGCWVHKSTICRCLRRLGMTRQKIKHVALQRSDCKWAEFIAWWSLIQLSALGLTNRVWSEKCIAKVRVWYQGSDSTRFFSKIEGKEVLSNKHSVYWRCRRYLHYRENSEWWSLSGLHTEAAGIHSFSFRWTMLSSPCGPCCLPLDME